MVGTWEGQSRGQSPSQLLFPFLLKIDPNTLCIIQKFRSLVAATRKPDPVALMSHLPSKGRSQRAVAGPQRMPRKSARAGNSQLGWGLLQEQLSPPHPLAKILESASLVPR